MVAVLAPLVSLAVVAGVVIQAKDWRPFSMPSLSMLPGLVVGDYFIVDRQAYAGGRLPQRGDIVVFYVPPQASPSPPADGRRLEYVKRIIGVPGDRVTIAGGIPSLNGVPLRREPLGEQPYGAGARFKAQRLREYLPNGMAYEILQIRNDGQYNNAGPFVVPAGAYFVMGDNRDDSLDSRVSFGTKQGQSAAWYVSLADIIGQANYVYWSGFDRLDRIGMALK